MRNILFTTILLTSLFMTQIGRASDRSPLPVKDWTLLVYLNANNSLDSQSPGSVNEMEAVGSTEKVNVVVQWASLAANTTKRLYIVKDNDRNVVSSPVIQDMGIVDMGDYHTLIDFVKWGVANYPAKHYFISLWDHGGGWNIMKLKNSNPDLRTTDISWDDNSGHFISTKELGLALAESAQVMGHKVDVYGSDACYMAMPEVAAEMGHSVDVFIGSEETEPGPGWPYDGLLTAWDQLKNPSGRDIATALTKVYRASYENGSHGTGEVTLSAFDLAQLPALMSAIMDLGNDLSGLDALGKQKVVTAIAKTENYVGKDNRDLLDFAAQLKASGVLLRGVTLQHVTSAMNDFVIANEVTTKYKNSHGVSIWLPSSTGSFSYMYEKYSQLTFDQITHWGASLKSILGAN